MRIVLDTNVLVSAMLRPKSKPARVLSAVLSGICVMLYDRRIVDEYRDVLSREEFAFSSDDLQRLFRFIRAKGEEVAPEPLEMDLPDPDDLPFAEVAVSADADAIVTGNRRHFPDSIGVPVLTPAELLAALEAKPES